MNLPQVTCLNNTAHPYEDNLRDLQDNIKRYNIRIIGVPEEEDKKKDHEKILEEIIVENFPKMGKEIATQVQETHLHQFFSIKNQKVMSMPRSPTQHHRCQSALTTSIFVNL